MTHIEQLSVTYAPARWAILAGCCLAGACFQLAAMSFSPLLGEIARDLGVQLPQAVELMTWFMLFSTLSFFISGPFVDSFGPMASILVSLMLTSFPTLALVWLGNSYVAIVVIRVLQGCSVGFCMSGLVPLIMRWFSVQQRSFALGITGAFIPLGAMLSMVIAPAAFTLLKNWRVSMGLISIIPFLSLIYCIVVFYLTSGKAPVLEPGTDVIEKKTFRAALLSRYTCYGIAVTFATNWLMQTIFSITPSYFSETAPTGLGLGPLIGGSLTTIMQIASIIAPVIGGYVAGRYFNGRPGGIIITAMLLVITYGALQLEVIYQTHSLFVLFLILPGIGIGMLMPMLQAKIAEVYPAGIVGRMNGLWQGIGSFGGTVGLFVSTQVLVTTGVYRSVINTIVLVAIVGSVMAILLNRVRSSKE